MKITLKSFATIRDVIGCGEVSLELRDGSTLGDLFDTLTERYGDGFTRQVTDKASGELVAFLILVNDTALRSIADMHTPLSDGDQVTIMIPFDGG